MCGEVMNNAEISEAIKAHYGGSLETTLLVTIGFENAVAAYNSGIFTIAFSDKFGYLDNTENGTKNYILAEDLATLIKTRKTAIFVLDSSAKREDENLNDDYLLAMERFAALCYKEAPKIKVYYCVLPSIDRSNTDLAKWVSAGNDVSDLRSYAHEHSQLIQNIKSRLLKENSESSLREFIKEKTSQPAKNNALVNSYWAFCKELATQASDFFDSSKSINHKSQSIAKILRELGYTKGGRVYTGMNKDRASIYWKTKHKKRARELFREIRKHEGNDTS